jgi:hypothetical protein
MHIGAFEKLPVQVPGHSLKRSGIAFEFEPAMLNRLR